MTMELAAIDAEFVDTSRPLAIAESAPLSREDVAQRHDDFEWLKARFLNRAKHIVPISGKDFVNALGWEHLAMCVGISLTQPEGRPKRDILEAVSGDRIVAYSAFIRATAKDGRIVERSGRCDSTEKKHNQYEHKIEQVASSRATSRAVAIMLGGADAIAEDQQEYQERARAEQPAAPARVTTAELIALHKEKGEPLGSLRAWLDANVTWNGSKLSPDQSVVAAEKLRAYVKPVTPATSSSGKQKSSAQQRALAMKLHSELRHDDEIRHAMYEVRFGVRSFNDLTSAQAASIITELQGALDAQGV